MVRIIGTLGKYDQRRLWKWTCINPFDLLFKKYINHKNLTFHWTKTIENGGKSHYEINVFLKYTLDTIIGTPKNYYE